MGIQLPGTSYDRTLTCPLNNAFDLMGNFDLIIIASLICTCFVIKILFFNASYILDAIQIRQKQTTLTFETEQVYNDIIPIIVYFT